VVFALLCEDVYCGTACVCDHSSRTVAITLGRRLLRLIGLVGVLGLITAALAAAGVSWGSAIEVPGTAALNHGDMANTDSISCARGRSCAAGGYYSDRAGHHQAFVVNEKNGVWRKAVEVPGSAALNVGGSASVDSIYCITARSCAAGGHFSDRAGHHQAFVVNEKNGVWRKAVKVPGSTLNRGGDATVYSISCATATSCAAGGDYSVGAGHTQAFVVSETNGVWGTAIEVPGSARLDRGGFAAVSSISCASARSCAAGGSYVNKSGRFQAFVTAP
jgi:hypothetical protein